MSSPTERELADAVEWLRSVLDNVVDGIISVDQHGIVATFNSAAERIFGYSAREVVGQNVKLLMPEPFPGEHGGYLAEYLKTGDAKIMGIGREVTGRRRDGSTFPMELAIGEFHLNQERFLTGIVRDISERKRARIQRQAEQQILQRHTELIAGIGAAFARGGSLGDILQSCAELLTRLLDAAFTQIWTLNDSEEILELQAGQGTHLDGVHSRIPVGKFTIGLIAREAQPYWTNSVSNDPDESDPDWARREGIVAFAGYPLLADGRVVGVMAVFARRPLSERVLDAMAAISDLMAAGIERMGAEGELRLRDRAIQTISLGILITDPKQPDNPIVYASPGFERLTGYAPEEVVGRNCRMLQGSDSNPQAVAELREAVANARACVVDILNYRRDGSAFWNSVAINPVFNSAGQLTHFVGVQTDVTERKLLEEQLRQSQKMEAIGSLAGGVAHDFNNLLTIINGYGEILSSQLPPEGPLQETVREIVHAGERAASLTRQLLAFSRKQVLAPKVINLNATVTDTAKMLRRLIGEDILLDSALDPALGRIKADPGQIEQVLINLAVNARDAMPCGGRLRIETSNVRLVGDYGNPYPHVPPGEYVMIAVSDEGCGMDEVTQARIFEPFFYH